MRHLVGKRGLTLLALSLVLVPMSAASLAYACTGLATATTSRSSGVAGSTVTVNGKGFAPHDRAAAPGALAEIRMDSMTGPVIGTGSPSGTNGSFAAQITVPGVDPGEHVLILTQNGADGRPVYGSPARTVFTVDPTPVAAPAAAAPASAPAAAVQSAPMAAAPVAVGVKASPPSRASRRAKAIARCTKKFNVKKAKTVAGRRRTLARRKACIKQARTNSY